MPDPRRYPQPRQPQYRQPQQPQQPRPGSWGPAPGYGGPPGWAQPGPSGPWGTPPPRPPKRNSTGLIVGAIVAVVVIVVGAVITVAVPAGPDNAKTDNEVVADPSTATSTENSSGASADEDGVAAAAEKRVELINTQDAAGLHRMACDADSRTESTAGYQALFDENGPVSASLDVRDVVVDGRIGTVEGVMSINRNSDDITWPFKKEDGEWRFCPSLSPSPSSGSTGDDDIITG